MHLIMRNQLNFAIHLKEEKKYKKTTAMIMHSVTFD